MKKLKMLWKYLHEKPILRLLSQDINADGHDEIIATTQNGEVLIFDMEGIPIFRENLSENSSIFSVEIEDINKDGDLNLILGAMDGMLRVFRIKEDFSLEPLWAHSFSANISGILVEDINQDSRKNLIVHSLDKSLRVLKGEDGELVWAQMFEKGVGEVIILKKDKVNSHHQVAACGNDGTLRIFDGNDGSLEWFKKYPNKLRSLCQFTILNTPLLICGGDDKELYYINRNTHKEVARLPFSDYIWRVISFTELISSNLFINTYSFAFLYENNLRKPLKFTSQIAYANPEQGNFWKIKGVNLEAVNLLKKEDQNYFCFTSTNGQILLVDESSGKILANTKESSSINCLSYISNEDLLLTGNNSGEINAYIFEDN